MDKVVSTKKIKYFLELVEILLIIFALSWAIREYVFDTTVITDNNMNPALYYNNKVLVDKFLFSTGREVERGDIIVFFDKSNKNTNIKRVLGLEGETVEIRDSYVYINKKPIYEPYTQTPVSFELAPFTVPNNHVFVLSDNRQTNAGLIGENIPIENIVGRVTLCYWPLRDLRIF